MKIALAGAGGVGAGFGAMLATAGHEIVALARGAHLQAIRERGLIVRRAGAEQVVAVQASDDPGDLGVADLVVFAVKLWDTEATARQIAPMIGPATMVLSLQNGIDSRSLLAPVLGEAALVGGVAHISAVIEAPGIVTHRSPFARIIAGEFTGAMTDRLTGLVDTFADAGIEARATPDIEAELWAKFAFITALSGATCHFRAPIGPIRDNPACAAFLKALVEEAVAVGRARGVALPEDQTARTWDFLHSAPRPMKASMLDDLEAGRRLELPWLAGRVAALGREAGIATPACDAVTLSLALHEAGPPLP